MVRTRILLVDDHKIIREGLIGLLQQQDGIEVAAEAENGRTAVELMKKLAVDVVVMDVTMTELNGIDACREILAVNSCVKVVALSMHSDKRLVAGMLRAGASGYVLKDCAFEELVRAIHAAVANETYLCPAIANVVVEDYMGYLRKHSSPVVPTLTGREREVLQLLAEGKNTKEVASCLHVSVKTVETHRKHIMDKLQMHSIAELTKYAVREGLTPLET